MALLMLLGGCTDLFSWSPSGRYLFWPGMGPDLGDWIWDSSAGTATKAVGPGPSSGGVLLNDDLDMLTMVDLPGDTKRGVINMQEASLYKGNPKTGNWDKILEKTYPNGFGLSPDRSTLYYAEEVGDPPQYELRAMDLKHPDQPKTLLKSPVDLYFPQVSPSGDQLLFTKEENGADKVCVLPLKSEGAEPKTLLEVKAFFPRWIDDSSFVFFQAEEGDFAKLVLRDIEHNQDRVLYPSAAMYSPPSVVQTQHAVYVAGLPKDFQGQVPDNGAQHPSLVQIIRIDTASGEVRQVTDDPLGAMYPAADPTGKRLAYINAINNPGIAHVVNLETSEKTVVWRNEEERLYAAAQRFQDLNDTAQALSTYHDLLNRFPNSDLRDPAWFNIMLIHLHADPPQLDEAILAMGELGSDLREQALSLFWQGTQPVATDPPNDYIRRYGTEASANEFKFDTDKTRDLIGLWARWSPSHLYLRIDFAVPHDLQGLGFMDYVILFSHASSTGSFHRITPCVEWDLPIEREIWIRHWTTGGNPGPIATQGPAIMTPSAQYDAEILDGTGNVLARFLGSGFFPASFPPCQVLGTLFNPDGTGSVVLAIDREMVQLYAKDSTRIQVCTTKGGVEEQRHLERPRETPQPGQPCCDIADAFGPENTAERIDADLAAGRPAVIRGAAATLTP